MSHAQVHGGKAVLDIKGSQIKENAKCGVLAFDGGEARLLAGTVVESNAGKAQALAGTLGSKAGRIVISKKAHVHGSVLEESKARVQAHPA